MRYISGYISKSLLLLLLGAGLAVSASGQDSLRTYGPRFGLDLARFAYVLADPSEIGAEASVDFELIRNLYPVVEMGYGSISEEEEFFSYESQGVYGRIGFDYNLINLKDRSQHHSFTAGLRYGISLFDHRASEIYVPNFFWGDYVVAPYENSLQGQWLELVAGVKAEMLSNLFMGWSVRYKILMNPGMDPLVPPYYVPGYGGGGKDRNFGFSYSIYYKIPLLKK